jgi:phosphotransferase system  glucose/maltose/N-acetylglucosamine-specific IIC component
MLNVINNGSKGIIGGAILMPLTTITNVATYTIVVVKILVHLVMFCIFSVVSKDSNDR